jgi:RNA polymerase sigma-70 factor (ECF subfamily)
MSGKSTPDACTEEQIVGRVVEGDKECYGALVKRYWGMAVALALFKIADPVEAEDVAQESFIQAYSHLHKLRDRSRFGGWLSKIVIQKSVEYIRKYRREKSRLTSGIESEPVKYGLSAANPILTDKQCEFVRETVRGLPAKFRKVLTMRFVAGLSSVEIARQLGKRPGTVRVWLHRAYQLLRKELAPLAEEVKES